MKKILFLVLILIFFFGCTQPPTENITKKTDLDDTGGESGGGGDGDTGGDKENGGTGDNDTEKEPEEELDAEEVAGDLTDLMDDLEGLEDDFT